MFSYNYLFTYTYRFIFFEFKCSESTIRDFLKISKETKKHVRSLIFTSPKQARSYLKKNSNVLLIPIFKTLKKYVC